MSHGDEILEKCESSVKKLCLIAAITAGILFSVSNPASAYTIDGSLTDWNINLSAALNKGYLDTHLPSGGLDIDYTTEDNADTKSTWTNVGPGYSYYNKFDAEALYFDNDSDNAYIAIITGLRKEGVNPPGNSYPPDGDAHKFKPGDIGIDVDGINGYEYGIDIDNSHLYAVNNWQTSVYSWVENSNPWIINTWDTDKGIVPFVYSDNQNTHYVLETKIPLNLLGLNANYGDPIKQIKIHWGMECGNDYLNLIADVNPVTPEPTTLALLGLGLLGLAGLKRKKS